MFNLSRFIACLDVGECMGSTIVAHQKRVTLREITGVFRSWANFHQTPVTVLGFSGRNSFGNNGTPCIFSKVNHFRPRVGLLVIVGYRNGIKFPDGMVSFQNATGYFQLRRCRFRLGSTKFLAFFAQSSFGHEIEYATFPILPPGYQFWTVEYLISAWSKAINSTTAACNWFSSRMGRYSPPNNLHNCLHRQ